ncbi:MAG TPA: hypothetical protein VE075_03975, partial [Thermoanaerobaculia bacterium]|nr:hypothetical protein [Thermoanaerobaculia bacterium]
PPAAAPAAGAPGAGAAALPVEPVAPAIPAPTGPESAAAESDVVAILLRLLGQSLPPAAVRGACTFSTGQRSYCAMLAGPQCDQLGGAWNAGEECPPPDPPPGPGTPPAPPPPPLAAPLGAVTGSGPGC